MKSNRKIWVIAGLTTIAGLGVFIIIRRSKNGKKIEELNKILDGKI